jgi:mercuric ion transport protein
MKLKQNKLLKIGAAGTIVAALCCFTPILAIVLASLGLSAIVGVLDYVLLPALAFFVGLLLYALWTRSKT